MSARRETLTEVNQRLANNPTYRKPASKLARLWYRPVPFGWFLIAFTVLLVGLLLLTGFVFHEVGIVTPLDGVYTWLHTTFGGMEEPAHVAHWSPDKWMW